MLKVRIHTTNPHSHLGYLGCRGFGQVQVVARVSSSQGNEELFRHVGEEKHFGRVLAADHEEAERDCYVVLHGELWSESESESSAELVLNVVSGGVGYLWHS